MSRGLPNALLAAKQGDRSMFSAGVRGWNEVKPRGAIRGRVLGFTRLVPGMLLVLLAGWICAAAAAVPAEPAEAVHPFAIHVIDADTGRGVPLVELRTVNDILLVTDSNGVAAFLEPGLMDREVFFHVHSHGYEYPADGFGNRGVRLQTVPNGSAQIKLKRRNIAERLYRVTGQGIYRDSLLAGLPVPLEQPLLNAGVLGCDSVTNAIYHGRVYWFWGDTNRAGYPLGNFHTTGAVSQLPGKGGLDPALGVDFSYFADERGFVRPMARFNTRGPTWISGLVVLRDQEGHERMFAHYVNVRGGDKPFQIAELGLAEFDDQEERFRRVAVFPAETPFPHGAHPVLHTDGGTEYVYYCDPYPLIRVPAQPEKLADPGAYEAFTPLRSDTRAAEQLLDRRADGSLVWAWKRATEPIHPREQQRLLRAGELQADEALLALRDVESGRPVSAHRGSVCWNDWRRRWVMIFCQQGGSSPLGEIWYAEADRLTGPWLYARKIVTHQRYSFYNPKQHPMFDQQGGRRIFFEGTYTAAFSGNNQPTPRYDYNQIMYRLDLADPRLSLPVAVYNFGAPALPERFATGAAAAGSPGARIAFWALDRAADQTLPVYGVGTSSGGPFLRVGSDGRAAEAAEAAEDAQDAQDADGKPVFYVLRDDVQPAPEAAVLLWEYADRAGRLCYLPEGASVPEEFGRRGRALGYVWPHPECTKDFMEPQR